MPSRCCLIFTEAYDPLDRRIKEETTQWGFTSTTWFAYDGGHIALRFDGDGSLTGRYLHGEAVDQIFAEEVGGQTRWTLTDHLGSVRDVVSDTGVTLGRITYDSFGQVTNTTGIVDTLFRYTARPGMATTGFYDYRARVYDPRLGQFASEDPIGFAGGDANLRRYVGNRATQYTDPSGLIGWDPLAAMGRLVGWWYGGTKGQAEQEVIAARTRAMEEAARAARQQTSIERQDRTYHGGAPSPGYHGVEPTLGGSNVPHGSDSADTASQSIGRGYGMVCLLGATALATAVEVGGILLPGPDDALIAAAVGAKGGYRVIRGIVEGSKGSTREIVVVLSKEGKVLSRTELEALRKCGAPRTTSLGDTLKGATATDKPSISRKTGGYPQANADFDALVQGSTSKSLPGKTPGRIATIAKGHPDLPEGTIVNVREKSSLGADRSGGQPTIEIRYPDGKQVKIRYD